MLRLIIGKGWSVDRPFLYLLPSGLVLQKPIIFKKQKSITMKVYFLPLLLLLGTAAFAQQQTAPSTSAILKEATTVAAKENKKVFLIFHASWCGWCHKMDTAMSTLPCKPLFDKNFVVRHIVVKETDKHKAEENAGGDELMAEYGAGRSGIPYWIIFDKNGKALADSQIRPDGADMHTSGENVGCPASEKEVNYFIKVLKQTAKLSDKELATITARFRKIETDMRH